MEEGLKNGYPPAYIMRGEAGLSMKPRRWGDKGGKCVWAYAVAVTTALMVTVVVGALYYHRSIDGLLASAQRPQSVDRPVLLSAPVVPQSAASVNNVVVFNMEGDTGVSGSQSVIDYSKGLTAVYDASKKMCYLASGIHTDIANSKLPSVFPTSKYSVDQSYSISDKSLVPAPLQSSCAGIPLHWLEQVVRETVHNMKKRATVSLSACVSVCYTATAKLNCQTISITVCPTLCAGITQNLAAVPVVGPILSPIIDSLGLSVSVSVFVSVCVTTCEDLPTLPLPGTSQCDNSICNSLCVTISAALAVSPGSGPGGPPAGAPAGAPTGPPAGPPAGPPGGLPTLPAGGGPALATVPSGGGQPAASLPAGGLGPVTQPAGGNQGTQPAGGPGPASEPAGGTGGATLPAGGAGPATVPAGGGAGGATAPAGGAGGATVPAGGAGGATVPGGP